MVSSCFTPGAFRDAGDGAGDAEPATVGAAGGSVLTAAVRVSILTPEAAPSASSGGGHAAVSMRCGGRRVYGAGCGAAGDSGLTAAGGASKGGPLGLLRHYQMVLHALAARREARMRLASSSPKSLQQREGSRAHMTKRPVQVASADANAHSNPQACIARMPGSVSAHPSAA